jgi:hypothetical protein
MLSHESQRSRDGVFHFAAIDDQIEHAVLEEELAALESVGQLLADGLLDHAWSREANQRAGLGDVQVAEHREACRDAAGGRIREDRDIGNVLLVESRKGGTNFRHLHQRQGAFHHAGAA